MKKVVIGILAHVDSGKTTLSEALLYNCGEIRKLGRVDHRNSFLDNDVIERERGITVFSKQAVFSVNGTEFTLLDTPGHVDFSAEAERTLQVLDAAILVISGTDGVQSHTETLWKLLKRYSVPTFIFVNKMDMPNSDRDSVLSSLRKKLSGGCLDFTSKNELLFEELSLCSEQLMESFLANETVSDEEIKSAVSQRKVFPCYFGSALKLDGINDFLDGLERYIKPLDASDEFSARIYKISDNQNDGRLTYMKITGGSLSVRDSVTYLDKTGNEITEKISRIRIYNGEKFKNVETAIQGSVCAVLGLSKTFTGQGLGSEKHNNTSLIEPVLTYRVIHDNSIDTTTLIRHLRVLEDEDPSLCVSYSEQTSSVQIQVMGEVQLDILKRVMQDRFGVSISFDSGCISYKETISTAVRGAGHYEPLRHYAEVHLLLEPLPRGSGLKFESDCNEDNLSRNWQRLILTHLKEKTHIGVLTGSPITDIKITLTAGKAHLKHTEGGDFRQATYRAVRHALRHAQSVILEPYYDFTLTIPQDSIGRAMTDLQNMFAEFDSPMISDNEAVIKGRAPVSLMIHYQNDVTAYTRGLGHLSCQPSGYDTCHNPEEVIAGIGYDCDSDIENTADSVFCSHGAGVVVSWQESAERMHTSPDTTKQVFDSTMYLRRASDFCKRAAEDEELMKIFEKTYGSIKREKRYAMRNPKEEYKPKKQTASIELGKTEYLLVDGYNIIHSWDNLKQYAKDNMDLARSILIDTLCNYQGFKQCEVILVFDAYKRSSHSEEIEKHNGISVVYTKSAETADTFIEKTAHKLSKNCRVKVATSDGMEQLIILGTGALRMTANELYEEINAVNLAIKAYIDSLNK